MTRVGRLLVALSVLAGTVGVVLATPAAACSCGGGDARSDSGAAFARADAAFVGVFQYRNDPLASEQGATGERTVLNHFTVEKVQKGDLGPEVDVAAAADEGACGLPARPGERVGVLLTAIPGGWKSSLCDTLKPNALASASKGPLVSGTVLVTILAVLAVGGVGAALVLGPGRNLRGRAS